MKSITEQALAEMLASIRGATFATIITETDPRLRKTGNTLGPVRKVSRVNVCIGFQYSNSVKRQQAREGREVEFEAQPRKWGMRIPGTVLVCHNGTLYLETKVERTLGHRYIDANGTEIPEEKVAPFLPARSASRQEVDREVIVRDYKLSSIVGIRVGGEDYLVSHAVPAELATA